MGCTGSHGAISGWVIDPFPVAEFRFLSVGVRLCEENVKK